MAVLGRQKKKNNKNCVLLLIMDKLKLVFLIVFSFTLNVSSNPSGKALGCFTEDGTIRDYKDFKGIKFETDKSVRVASLKLKNNQLKLISKTTPYRIDDKIISFKLKSIWYGNIFFEEFNLIRKDLGLVYKSKNKVKKLKCEFISEDFMRYMGEKKDLYQELLDKKLQQNIL